MLKRLKILFVAFAVLVSAIICRLFYISVIDGERLSKMAVSQRTESVRFQSPRGIIYDRNMLKLTDAEMELVVKDGKPYYVNRGKSDILSHVIGYISGDGSGCGIEGAFDYVLAPDSSSTIAYLKDINNNRISDGYSINLERKRNGVALTIDYHVQKIVEKAMDNHSVNGAVIVADCKTGEILAMASRPNFDRKNLADYLDGTDGELVNKGIQAYNPGSVFKIIVAAAALENSFNEDMLYECNGKTTVDGMEFNCHKEDGHGVQNIPQSFANSCNCAFYEIGTNLGGEEIKKLSTALGIGNEVLGINGILEKTGNVPDAKTKPELANISIGQGDVMVTPLQIADVLCTLCNGGVRKQMTLIRGVVDDDGNCAAVSPADRGRVLSETTSRRLMNMLRLGVSQGTGSSAQIEKYGAGGKTGTAETGWKKDGELMQQGWFAGFFPAENPRYVCVVIAENGKSGSSSACPVFKEIGTGVCAIR